VPCDLLELEEPDVFLPAMVRLHGFCGAMGCGLSCAEQKRESYFCLLTNPVRASALRCVLYKEALENIFAAGASLASALLRYHRLAVTPS
jgi:hypothetical protein